LNFDDDDFFYDNPELLLSDSEVEEQGQQEVEVQQGSRRQPTVIDENSIKHIFREQTWSQSTNEYSEGALPFIGDPPGVKKSYRRMPSFLHLFGLFWTREVLRNICIETNQYARVIHEGKSQGGEEWYDVDEKELRTFMAISLYMDMKKQPNVKNYWAKSEKLFYCPVIANLLTQRWFLALRKCLHLTNPSEYVTDKSSPLYDKMHQCRWLLNVI
jgi:hypothetical protein